MFRLIGFIKDIVCLFFTPKKFKIKACHTDLTGKQVTNDKTASFYEILSFAKYLNWKKKQQHNVNC